MTFVLHWLWHRDTRHPSACHLRITALGEVFPFSHASYRERYGRCVYGSLWDFLNSWVAIFFYKIWSENLAIWILQMWWSPLSETSGLALKLHSLHSIILSGSLVYNSPAHALLRLCCLIENFVSQACFELIMFVMLAWKLVPELKKPQHSDLIQLLVR